VKTVQQFSADPADSQVVVPSETSAPSWMHCTYYDIPSVLQQYRVPGNVTQHITR